MPGMTLTFTGLDDAAVRRILTAVNGTGEPPVTLDVATERLTKAAAAAPAADVKPPKKKKAETEPVAPAPAVVTAWPLGGPIVEPLDLAEVKRRSILFMENPMGGGDRFAAILAEFAIQKISQLPAAKFRAFVDALVPESAAVEPGAGDSLLD